MNRIIAIAVFSLLAVTSKASATTFTGYITELYASQTGAIAFKVQGGFPEAAIATCTTYNGFAGSTEASEFLKSLMLAAKLSERELRFSVDGCDAGGAWIKIKAAYLL